MQETEEQLVQHLGLEDPLEEGMATHFLPGKSHGWRSLEGHGLWGCKELNTIKQLNPHTSIYLLI